MPVREVDAVTRRQFLRRLGLAVGPVMGAGLLDDLAAMAQPARPLHVVIVGAGLAGLCAALELERRGHRCTILEVERRHVGGRVRTLRFEGGLHGEAGAMRIPQAHALTRLYVKEFGLELRRFVQSNPEAYAYLRGQRTRMRDVKRLASLYALGENERDRSPDELWADSLVRRLEAMSPEERADLSATTPVTPAVRTWDQRSLQQLLDDSGLGAEAVEYLASAYGLETLLASAATEHLREERERVWTQEFHEIVGGTDRLPAAFAARLRSKPRAGCEVTALQQDPDRRRAAAIYREAGLLRRVEGDALLCTLPFPVLTRLAVTPPFSGGKQRAIRELNYDSSTKVLAIARRRFWEGDDGIFGGGTFTDLPSGTTWYPSDNVEARDRRVTAGPGVLLASYTWGQAARRLSVLGHTERCATVLRHLAQVHPQLGQPGVVGRTASWSWDTHPWSGGAFAWFMPGQHTALHRYVVASEGRIFFAGEHASLTHTWMQGALESALVAVREILASVTR